MIEDATSGIVSLTAASNARAGSYPITVRAVSAANLDRIGGAKLNGRIVRQAYVTITPPAPFTIDRTPPVPLTKPSSKPITAPTAVATKAPPPSGVPAAPGKPICTKAQGVVATNAQKILSGFTGPAFAVAYNPARTVLAVAEADGMVRLFDVKSGTMIKQLVPVSLADASTKDEAP